MQVGIYESLITESLKAKLSSLDSNKYYVANNKRLDIAEASIFLGNHLSAAISNALKVIKIEKGDLGLVEKQIEITNNLLKYLSQQIDTYEFQDDLVAAEGNILEGVLKRLEGDYSDLKIRINEIMPSSRLTQSELFTGGNAGISLESELKKEIRSADRVDLLVSFIKWKAIVILKSAFEEFASRGGKLRIITTTYMGATDAKAIEELSKLPNAEVKVSYNTANERLHAKAYLFYRNSGFHTGYIGSSNFSRSALTDGLEWNIKVTTKEIPHIINKFKKTFESYWSSGEFELYDCSKYEQLSVALHRNTVGKPILEFHKFFDLKPYHYQMEILEKLKVERTVHGSNRNLVVAATGTGKTMIAAFDFKNYRNQHPDAKFLFVAHRIEILRQALHSFRNVLKDQNFGDLLGDGYQPSLKNAIFATVQTFNNLNLPTYCSPDYYNYIVIDEVHHIQTGSYQKIIQYFKPELLLGLTATPERMDGKSILSDFNFRIAAEIRLPDALNNKLLCPFQYFGISDTVDYSAVKWNNGRYDVNELTKVLTANDFRVRDIIANLEKYVKDLNSLCCIGFCASKDHAYYMAEKFNAVGLRSEWLTSDNSSSRISLVERFKSGDFNFLFVVDMFNEGVDIPQIDTVLFLRPTESLTIFLQQLGRGLRLHDGKDVLTVLDFVGQAREEYDFERKFRSLIGKTNTTVEHEIERDFPNLPLGSSIVLERKAKEYILENIRKATNLNKRQLISRLVDYNNQTAQPLTLQNFLNAYNLTLKDIYKNFTFSELKSEALNLKCDSHNSEKYRSMLGKKWIVTESLSYFRFWIKLIENKFDLGRMDISDDNDIFALMAYYDFYQKAGEGESLKTAIKAIGDNGDFVRELSEFLSVKIDQLCFEELPVESFSFPLGIHSRFTREQILVALRLSTWEKQSSNREGAADNTKTNMEGLFINLKKSEEDFSPTTMYEDYAISETLFHWQSQNQTSSTSSKGLSYINQLKINKKVLLFVRESKKDANGFTQGYIFLGPANFVDYEGSKPMSIKWELQTSLPNYLWKESAKMLVG